MKMKLLPIFFALALLFSGIAFAQNAPFPIAVQVSGLGSSSIAVEIVNTATGDTVTEWTNDHGEVVIDWNNYGYWYTSGNVFEIRVGDETKSFTYNGIPPSIISFTFNGAVASCPIVDPVVCPEPIECPVHEQELCVVRTTLGYNEHFVVRDNVCDISVRSPQETVCPEIPDVQDDGIEWVHVIITAVITLIAGYGGGMKIYKSRAGDAKFLHKHRGIRGYHDPNTLHRNPKYRHRRWKDDPIGCIEDVKTIEEKGGLTDA